MNDVMQAVIDKQAICEAMLRYCHGADRCDLEMLQSAFWPEGKADYGAFVGPTATFCEVLIPTLKGMTSTMHNVSNSLITLRGKTAKAMSNCVSYHQVATPDGVIEMVSGGRYLDDFEKRGEEWRILNRTFVLDWNRTGPSSSAYEGMFAQLTNRGARYPDDLYYRHLAA
jgi:hypothetical protein